MKRGAGRSGTEDTERIQGAGEDKCRSDGRGNDRREGEKAYARGWEGPRM